ncbi:imidazole glycerol phosphate synthase subunit HisH [Candidatus Vidania fulgoroideorum]
MKIGILNFGVGNIKSVISLIKKIKIYKIIIINNFKKFKYCDKFIFPGQGNCNNIKKNIKNIELLNQLKKEILLGKHFLGICLGKQIIFNFNNEANLNGISISANKVIKFKKKPIPCIGWCETEMRKHFLLKGLKKKTFFYHSHSYYTKINRNSIGISFYNFFFSSIYCYKNILLTQFHPELSGKKGLIIFKNFLKWK